jgi:hypothetical protein
LHLMALAAIGSEQRGQSLVASAAATAGALVAVGGFAGTFGGSIRVPGAFGGIFAGNLVGPVRLSVC